MDGMSKKMWKAKSSDEVSTKAAGPAEKDATAKRTLDEAAMTPFLREITLVSSGGAFLDGYVLSLIGVALTQITTHMSLTTHWTALIGASVLLGILVGSISIVEHAECETCQCHSVEFYLVGTFYFLTGELHAPT